ncbi:MAG: glycosyltransferase family 39 protein [Chloroflexota bacterium]
MCKRWPIDYLFLCFVLLLAAALRFTNLESNPGWYSDEGTHLEIVRHLLDGRVQYLAINQSHLLFSRLPLFGRLLAFTAGFQGVNMPALRSLTAALGTISVGLTYLATKRLTKDEWLPLLAALSLAIYPEAVLYSRLGFSYGVLAPLLLLALWGFGLSLDHFEFAEPQEFDWGIWVAAGAIGLGMISDLAMISLTPLLIWYSIGREWSNLDLKRLFPLLFAGLPLGLFVFFQMISNGDAFWFDLAFVRSRLGGKSILDQLWLIGQNFTLLLNQSSWFALGFVGLWLIPDHTKRNMLLLGLACPLLILGRSTPLVELGFYYIAWVLPVVAVGLGALLRFGAIFLVKQVENDRMGQVMVFILIVLPLAISTGLTWQRVQNQFGTNIDPFLLNAADAIVATDFVNNNLDQGDVVLASPGLAWRIDGKVADFQMALAAEGIGTPHLPADLPSERFEFDPTFENARYVVEDNLWRNWAYFHIPELVEKREIFQQWPIVFQSGEITVFENPID